MVTQCPLEALFMVRVHAGQPTKKFLVDSSWLIEFYFHAFARYLTRSLFYDPKKSKRNE